MITWDVIEEFKNRDLVKVTKHRDVDLYIINYTKTCQYQEAWTKDNVHFRGLIVDKDCNIVAKPFPKYWNWSEHLTKKNLPTVHWNPKQISLKVDGSLGILYWPYGYGNGLPHLATRGSFESDQAIKGTEILHKVIGKNNPTDIFKENVTYLFEIIYPENRIVIPYEKEDLILLAAICNTSWKDVDITNLVAASHFEIPTLYDSSLSTEKLLELIPNDGSHEGIVVLMKDGNRVKIKTPEYCRLHKICTELTCEMVWSYVANRMPLEQVLGNVPDELYDIIRNYVNKLKTDFYNVFIPATLIKQKVENLTDKKQMAEGIFKETNDKLQQTIALSLLKNDMIGSEDILWKALKPKSSELLWSCKSE